MASSSSPTPAPASTGMGGAIIGREREQTVLRDALAAALAGRGSLVLIGGEAGIGKTTLGESTLAEAASHDALVLVGRCYDLAETPPYGPWVEGLARCPGGDTWPSPPDLAGGSSIDSQATLLASVRDYFAALAARQPVVLLLDDLHWADPASLDLLRFLSRQLAALPLLLLTTYRSDELGRRHPLYGLLPTLEREARAIRLDLRPLGESALRALVGHYALRDAEAQRLVAWLHGRAEGNVFFIGQLLRALEDAEVLTSAGNGWVLGDLTRVGLPVPLRQVLDARLARLGEAHLRLLALAAVVGHEIPLDLWEVVADTDEDGLLDAIDAAAEAGVLLATPDGLAVRFAHALFREALYEGILATRRRRLHLRAAEALLAPAVGGSPDPDAVAYHFRQAGDPRAGEWLERAGGRAQRAYAWVTAAERYEAALALLEGRADQARQRALLLMTLAQLRRYDQTDRGLAALEEAAPLAAASGDAALVAATRFDHGHLQCFAGSEM